jgi:hypothetical protein
MARAQKREEKDTGILDTTDTGDPFHEQIGAI